MIFSSSIYIYDRSDAEKARKYNCVEIAVDATKTDEANSLTYTTNKNSYKINNKKM